MEDGGGVIGWGYEISCVLGREGVYTGVYYVNIIHTICKMLMYVFVKNHQPEDGHKRRNM